MEHWDLSFCSAITLIHHPERGVIQIPEGLEGSLVAVITEEVIARTAVIVATAVVITAI